MRGGKCVAHGTLAQLQRDYSSEFDIILNNSKQAEKKEVSTKCALFIHGLLCLQKENTQRVIHRQLSSPSYPLLSQQKLSDVHITRTAIVSNRGGAEAKKLLEKMMDKDVEDRNGRKLSQSAWSLLMPATVSANAHERKICKHTGRARGRQLRNVRAAAHRYHRSRRRPCRGELDRLCHVTNSVRPNL
jgi:hypothetical protein